jgi:hypothetical protein
MSTEAMKLALEALEETRNALTWFYDSYPQDVTKKGDKLLPHVETVLTTLREALAAPMQQEPVAWMHEWEDGEKIPMLKGGDGRNQDKPKTVRPLVYGDTSPQQAPVQQEPVAWGIIASKTGRICLVELDADEVARHNPKHIVPLYTSPPAQQEPLTDKEIADIATSHPLTWVNLNTVEHRRYFARAIEAKLREENHENRN